MFTGLSTVATRRMPPRLGCPWAAAVLTPGPTRAPSPAPAANPHARGQVPREILVHDPAGPADLVHDGRALSVALLDARRVHEDPEGAHEPRPALDHQRDVLVASQRAVLDRRDTFLDGEPQAGAA